MYKKIKEKERIGMKRNIFLYQTLNKNANMNKLERHSERSEESSIHAAFRFFTPLRSVQNDIKYFTIVVIGLVLITFIQ